MPEAALPRCLGLIGCGQIGLPVIKAWIAGELPGWEITGVLARAAHAFGPIESTASSDDFFAGRYDLIVETAGPRALAAHGVRALALAPVWTVSAAALADAALVTELECAANRSGHRLRVLPGAIAGLDGVAMACVDPDARVHVDIEMLPATEPSGLLFTGTVRDACARFPDSVNVAAAIALAGPGLDRSSISVSRSGPVPRHRLAVTVHSRYGTVQTTVMPEVAHGLHPVAACVVAALRRELQAIWSG